MAAVSTVIAGIGLAVSAIGTFSQIQGQRSAQKQSQRQFEESNALRAQGEAKSKQLADLQTMRAKRAAARDAQIKRADIASTAEARGAGASSPVQGARASIDTQTGNNISFLDTANTLHSQASSLFGQASEAANRPIFGDTWGAGIASFGGSLFKGSESIARIFSSFDTPDIPTPSYAGFNQP